MDAILCFGHSFFPGGHWRVHAAYQERWQTGARWRSSVGLLPCRRPDKYRAAAACSQRLLQERASLEAEIAAAGNSHAAIAATEGPEFVVTERSSPERRLQLRVLIAQRIERIDLVWSPTILGAGNIGSPEKPYALATVRFRNGASQMVIFHSREKAQVLKLGPETKL